LCIDLPSGRLLDLADDPLRLVVGELERRRQLHVEAPLLARDEAIELAGDLFDLGDPALLRRQPQKVPDELVCAAEQLLEEPRLRARVDLRVAENRSQ